MFHNKTRRFRRRSNGRNRPIGGGMNDQPRMRFNSFTNGHNKNRFHTTQSAEKLFEKYNALAKEALSSGDKSLSENYLQHADHYTRIIESKKKNQEYNKIDNSSKTVLNNDPITEDKSTVEDSQTKEK